MTSRRTSGRPATTGRAGPGSSPASGPTPTSTPCARIPTRQGLLYAATQHGVYISYDDGAHWQELNPALPDLPIVDLIVEQNELVIAAHGRGFWMLDNLAPLRQAAPDFTTRPVTLFDPPVAYRSANGATLSWWLAKAPKEARLEILDASGTVVRTFLSADSTSGAGPLGRAIPARPRPDSTTSSGIWPPPPR